MLPAHRHAMQETGGLPSSVERVALLPHNQISDIPSLGQSKLQMRNALRNQHPRG